MQGASKVCGDAPGRVQKLTISVSTLIEHIEVFVLNSEEHGAWNWIGRAVRTQVAKQRNSSESSRPSLSGKAKGKVAR